MIDAKRLAELMAPGELRGLAEYLGNMGEANQMIVPEREALDSAVAVLREVAGREAGTDKVIEIDLDDPGECIFCNYEQGYCHADHDFDPRPRSCVQGTPQGKTAPAWCHARGRVIVQAKK